MRRRLTAIILLIFSFSLLGEEMLVSIPRRLKIYMAPPGGMEKEEVLVLKESLLLVLSEAEGIMVFEPVETSLPGNPGKDAAALGGDAWLTVKISSSGEELDFSCNAYDLLAGEAIFTDFTFTRDSSFSSLQRTFWRPLVTELDKALDSTEETQNVKEVVKKVTVENPVHLTDETLVTVTGAPGTIITGLGESIVLDDRGRGEARVPHRAYFRLQGTHEDFYPVTREIYTAERNLTVDLQQKKVSSMGGEIFFQYFDYPGLGYSYSFNDRIYAGIRITTFLLKAFWPDPEKDSLESPLFHIQLLGGYYFNDLGGLLRYYISGGAYLALLYLPEQGLVVDPLSPFAITLPTLGVEISPWERYRFFLEYSLTYYYSFNGDYLKAALMGVENEGGEMTAGYIFFTKGALDLLNFKVGFRLQF